jgi:molybdenum cofactor cytidylyltransferase
MIAAIVLAAGQSRRMGRPKMILPWGSTTVIGRVVSVLAEAGVPETVVVTGGARQEVEAALENTGVRLVHNPDFVEGEMTRSLQIGLESLGEGVEAALVVLGDQPQIEAVVVRRILQEHLDSGASLVVPSFRMRRGHPWLITRSLWAKVLALQPPQTLRDFLQAQAGRIHYCEVTSPSVLMDLDTPDDYERHRP